MRKMACRLGMSGRRQLRNGMMLSVRTIRACEMESSIESEDCVYECMDDSDGRGGMTMPQSLRDYDQGHSFLPFR